jgi:hypothetical protein
MVPLTQLICDRARDGQLIALLVFISRARRNMTKTTTFRCTLSQAEEFAFDLYANNTMIHSREYVNCMMMLS